MIEVEGNEPTQSKDINEVIKALIEFHKKVGKVEKNSTNPHFKQKYGDLNAYLSTIKQPLEEAGLLMVQSPYTNGLKTSIYHTSGQFISSSMKMKPQKDDPQGCMSANTYMRRCQISSLLCLNAEDDDGNKASEKPKPQIKVDRFGVIKEIKALYSDSWNEEQKAWYTTLDTLTDTQLCNALTDLKG